MKQCEPLKDLLIVPKECPPCPPGLGSRRLMPMGHVGIVASDPVAGASDLVAVDVRTQELPKVFILREQYDKLDPAFIREKQEEAHCILVPVERNEMDRIRQESVVYTKPPEIPKLSDIRALQPTVYDLPHVKGGRYHEPSRDQKKKKKAKRRQQKQARRKNK